MHPAAGDRIERTLDGAVTAPDEEQVRALVAQPAGLLRDLLGLRHLDPRGVGEPVARERAAELREPSVEGLGRVCEDRDRGHARTAGAATLGAVDGCLGLRRAIDAAVVIRVTMTAQSRLPAASATLPRTSVA